MSQLVSARPFIIMPQEDIALQLQRPHERVDEYIRTPKRYGKNVSGLMSWSAVKTRRILWGSAVMEELHDTVIEHF